MLVYRMLVCRMLEFKEMFRIRHFRTPDFTTQAFKILGFKTLVFRTLGFRTLVFKIPGCKTAESKESKTFKITEFSFRVTFRIMPLNQVQETTRERRTLKVNFRVWIRISGAESKKYEKKR